MNKLLSGGAGYLIMFLIASGLIGGVWLKYNSAINRAERAESALEQEQAITASQRLTIDSQARTGDRRAIANTQQQKAEDAINAEPETTNCASSPAIMRGFSIMRDNDRAKADTDIEQPSIQV